MVGNNSASVVSDAILKGVTPAEDVEALYEAMLSGRNEGSPDRIVDGPPRARILQYARICSLQRGDQRERRPHAGVRLRRLVHRLGVAAKLGRTEDAAMLEKAAQNYPQRLRREDEPHARAATKTARSRRRSAPTSGATPTPKATPGTTPGRYSTTSRDWPT